MSNYVFHKDGTAKIVTDEEYQGYLDNGWSDTPATFAIKDTYAGEAVSKEEVLLKQDPEINTTMSGVFALPEKKKIGRPPKLQAQAS